MEAVIGLDVGTGSARALALGEDGRILAQAVAEFAVPPAQPAPGLAEQDAEEWWRAGSAALRALVAQLSAVEIVAVAVDSTSGTFTLTDAAGRPLLPGLMYNDGRGKGLETEVNAAAGEFTRRLGYKFPPAFSLVKLYWLAKHRPELLERAHCVLHAADFLVGRLTGQYGLSDTSNSLKSGVDLLTGEWPEFIENKLGIPLAKLPLVVRPGELLSQVSAAAGETTGLPAGTPVVAGASDGTASFLASGAGRVGDWNFTLGTTIAIRGVSSQLVRDPGGRLYCHRHPEGYWLPGGASNCGGEALIATFGQERLAELDDAAADRLDTNLVVYPLVRRGERMPFVSASAEGFTLGEAAEADESELYAAYLEGLALVTRWSLDEAAKLGAETDGEYFLSGGGGKGRTLGRLLATALERPLRRAAAPDAAMGSALLAAGWQWYSGSVSRAQAELVKYTEVFEPLESRLEFLQARLEVLQAECARRGYL